MKNVLVTCIFILSIPIFCTAQKIPSYEQTMDIIDIENTIDAYLELWIQQDEANITKAMHTDFIPRTFLREKQSAGTILSFAEFMQSAPKSTIKWYIDDTIYTDGFAKSSVKLISPETNYHYFITLDRINGRWTISGHDFENYK